MTLNTIVTKALDRILARPEKVSVKEDALRRLGLAQELARKADKLKEDAKKELENLGIRLKGWDEGKTHVVFDGKLFKLEARVANGSQLLNDEALRDTLANERLSAAARARILAGARRQSAGRVTLIVTDK